MNPDAAPGRQYRAALLAVRKMLAERRSGEAAALCRELITTNETSVEPLLLLGRARQQQGRFDDMLELAEAAIARLPAHRGAKLQLIEACIFCGLHDRALAALKTLEAGGGNDPNLLQHVAQLYTHNSCHDDAHRCYQQAVALQPDDMRTQYNYAASCVATGDIEQAEKAYGRVIDAEPRDHDAWQNRSALRRQTVEDNHIEALTRELQSLPPNAIGEVPLCYALAKEHEDVGNFETGFDYLARGASARRRRMQYDVQTDVTVMERIAACFAENYAARAPAPAHEGPIFVMGLPRSGTTLVDRIISSHSEVESLGEINDLALTLTRLGRTADKNELLQAATRIDPAALGAAYLQSVASYGNNSRFFIDKTPANFLYAGLIAKALPGARLVHLRRHPVDSCLGMYRTLFRMGYPFSYDLDDLACYYIAYAALMDHWRRLFPDIVFDVSYEGLVNDQEGVSRDIIAHCGLEWEPACLAFDKNRAPVATASAAQVRQPMYRDAVDRWRRYAKQLTPLIKRLEAAGIET